jgi:hypothetical protein
MPLLQQSRLVSRAALLVATCFCLLGLAQVACPLGCIGSSGSTAFAATHLHLARHTLQEVSPRTAQPQAPHAVGRVPVIALSDYGQLPRITPRETPQWSIENWPTHQRVAPDSADDPRSA